MRQLKDGIMYKALRGKPSIDSEKSHNRRIKKTALDYRTKFWHLKAAFWFSSRKLFWWGEGTLTKPAQSHVSQFPQGDE